MKNLNELNSETAEKINTLSLKELMEYAHKSGIRAFEEGRSGIPAMSTECEAAMYLLDRNDFCEFMINFADGWTEANLSAPIPDL